MISVALKNKLAEPFALSDEQIAFYQENGFIKIKAVFDAASISEMDAVISAEVKRLNTQHLPMEERDTYGKAFIQVMNIWRQSELVKEIVFSQRLAGIATQLMQTHGVRLYHDQALYKEPGGGITPWHADQYYWPLETDKSVTVWIPLQETPMEMGPLEFSAGSFRLTNGRQLAISDESQQMIADLITAGQFKQEASPFTIGEVSFHKGWLYHRAGANQTDKMRSVMTMIYMDKDMKLKMPENKNQQADWDAWCPGAQVGEVIDTEMNPVLFEQ